MARLYTYAIFHLNLAFSSIEEEARPQVVEKCYWPLLKLSHDLRFPIGIEATGFTLSEIERIDPTWIEELKRLIDEGLVEFIGSGYAQLIGPLAPATVVRKNLEFGHGVYEEILGARPRVALVNEQAFSSGLVPHYLDAGYRSIVLDYDNMSGHHPEWSDEVGHFPQLALGTNDSQIDLIWTRTVAFQKFQRFAHGDLEFNDYVGYLRSQVGQSPRCFAIYGNDAEVFDFRPGRLHTEATLSDRSEWARIAELIAAIKKDSNFSFVLPSELPRLPRDQVQLLQLESAAHPIPVKKQYKYNIARWALTGRADLYLNTLCWRFYEALCDRNASDEDWKELCYLWSSDFRTHLTEKRWLNLQNRIASFESKLSATKVRTTCLPTPSSQIEIDERDGKIDIKNDTLHLVLNKRKGNAIHRICRRQSQLCDGHFLSGTLEHGFFEDISHSFDWFSGTLTIEQPGRPKVTDLQAVEPVVSQASNKLDPTIRADLNNDLFEAEKCIEVYRDRITIDYQFNWKSWDPRTLRFNCLTLNPRAFDLDALSYRTHNGGDDIESFPMNGLNVDHGAAVSWQVSASSGLGMTEGYLDIGDRNVRMAVTIEKSDAAMLGMITHHLVGDQSFLPLCFECR